MLIHRFVDTIKIHEIYIYIGNRKSIQSRSDKCFLSRMGLSEVGGVVQQFGLYSVLLIFVAKKPDGDQLAAVGEDFPVL